MGFHLWLYEYLLKYLININLKQSREPTPTLVYVIKRILPQCFPFEFQTQSKWLKEKTSTNCIGKRLTTEKIEVKA